MNKIHLYKGDCLESICAKNNCEFFIAWSYDIYPCYSCKKIGESHNVVDIPDDCEFMEFIEDTVVEKGLS